MYKKYEKSFINNQIQLENKSRHDSAFHRHGHQYTNIEHMNRNWDERSPEGFYYVKQGIEQAISRGKKQAWNEFINKMVPLTLHRHEEGLSPLPRRHISFHTDTKKFLWDREMNKKKKDLHKSARKAKGFNTDEVYVDPHLKKVVNAVT